MAAHVQRQDGQSGTDSTARGRYARGFQAATRGTRGRAGGDARGGVGGVARSERRRRGRDGFVRRIGRKLVKRSGRFQTSRERPTPITYTRVYRGFEWRTAAGIGRGHRGRRGGGASAEGRR